MIKQGYRLYATNVYGKWFIKQAKSPTQFKRMCIGEEKAGGYTVPPRFGKLYLPELEWSDRDKVWLNTDGTVYGKKLPIGARTSLKKV